jgi:hypothetical protein
MSTPIFREFVWIREAQQIIEKPLLNQGHHA